MEDPLVWDKFFFPLGDVLASYVAPLLPHTFCSTSCVLKPGFTLRLIDISNHYHGPRETVAKIWHVTLYDTLLKEMDRSRLAPFPSAHLGLPAP